MQPISNQTNMQSNDIRTLSAAQRSENVENALPISKELEERSSSKTAEPDAVYVHEMPESPGKYSVSVRPEGKSIQFDPPTTAASMEKEDEIIQSVEPPKSASIPAVPKAEESVPDCEEPETKAQTTTCNTDAVDRELEMLRQQQTSLEAQISSASGEDEAKALEQELAKVQRELAIKDNDSYRRAHAHFS